MAEVDVINLLSGLGINAPLAWVCWNLFQKLQDSQERERKMMKEQLDLFQEIALKSSEEQDV